VIIAEEEEAFPRRKEGQRECNRLIGLYATGVRCTLPASGRWPLLHQDAAQRSDAGEDILGVQATLKQDQGSEMTPTCAELIDTSAAGASSLSMTQKKGSDTLHRGQIFRWTDDHLRLTNVKRSQAAERQTQSAMRIDVHPFRSGSPSIYCKHDAPHYMCEARPNWNRSEYCAISAFQMFLFHWSAPSNTIERWPLICVSTTS
jgi:hypothetical protein